MTKSNLEVVHHLELCTAFLLAVIANDDGNENSTFAVH
jgi:hypothetical protein